MLNKLKLDNSPENRVSFQRTAFRRYFFLILTFSLIAGFTGAVFRIFWLIPQSDEVTTLVVTSVDKLEFLLQYMNEGIDVSLFHNIIVFIQHKIWGESLISQRFLSLIFFLSGLLVLYKILINKLFEKSFAIASVLLLALSRTGIFLATDGRFYSLLFLCCIIHLFLCLKLIVNNTVNKKLIFLFLLLISVLGVLTTPLFIFYLLIINVIVLTILFFRKLTNKQIALVFFSELIIISALYFFLFHKGIPKEILAGFAKFNNNSTDSVFYYFPEVFLKWFALPEIIFIPVFIVGFLFSLLLVLITISFIKSGNNHNLEITEFFIFSGGIYATAALVAVTFYFVISGISPWAFRYFTPVYFFAPLTVILFIKKIKESRTKKILLTFISIVILLQSVALVFSAFKFKDEKQHIYSEMNKVLKTKLKTDVLPENIIIVLNNPREDIRFYWQLYIMFPEQRNKLKAALPLAMQTSVTTYTLIEKHIKKSGYIKEQELNDDLIKHSVFITSGKPYFENKNAVNKKTGIEEYYISYLY